MTTTAATHRPDRTTDAREHKMYLAGEWATSPQRLEVTSPYDGRLLGVTYEATREQLEQAIVAAQRAFLRLITG